MYIEVDYYNVIKVSIRYLLWNPARLQSVVSYLEILITLSTAWLGIASVSCQVQGRTD